MDGFFQNQATSAGAFLPFAGVLKNEITAGIIKAVPYKLSFTSAYRITESQNVRGWKGPLWVI